VIVVGWGSNLHTLYMKRDQELERFNAWKRVETTGSENSTLNKLTAHLGGSWYTHIQQHTTHQFLKNYF
jgi:hypothetical protein